MSNILFFASQCIDYFITGAVITSMKLLFFLLISLTTQMAFSSDFTDWASGIAEELGAWW